MCDDYDDKADSLTFVITEDENGNAVLRAPLPTISFEMPEDELIRFLVALKNNEDTAKIIDGKPIGFERVVDETAFMVKLQEAVEVTNTESEILSRAISHYGEPAQVLKCIEELCELGIELCRSLESITETDYDTYKETEEEINKTELQNELASAFYRIKNMDGNDYTLDKRRQTEVTSELADVSITTQQMLKIFTTPEEFEKVKQAKLSRLVERMNGDGDSQ
jgi:hypothetical protein